MNNQQTQLTGNYFGGYTNVGSQEFVSSQQTRQTMPQTQPEMMQQVPHHQPMSMTRGVAIPIKRPLNTMGWSQPVQMIQMNQLNQETSTLVTSNNCSDMQKTGSTTASSTTSGSPRTQIRDDHTKKREKMTAAERKKKEKNMLVYTRLFLMSILSNYDYLFILKKKRKQKFKDEIYAISKIIFVGTNEILVDRTSIETSAKELVSQNNAKRMQGNPKKINENVKKDVEKYIDATIDNFLLDLITSVGYTLESKENSLFTKSKCSGLSEGEEEFVKRTLTLLHVTADGVNKSLTREAIYDNYKEFLDVFVQQLQYD